MAITRTINTTDTQGSYLHGGALDASSRALASVSATWDTNDAAKAVLRAPGDPPGRTASSVTGYDGVYVVGVAAGSATITLTMNGHTDTCVVTVIAVGTAATNSAVMS